MSAPGHSDEARLVLSWSGKCPHFVLPTKVGFKCNSECTNFKSLGLCSHTVVVAQLNYKSSKFVTQIKRAKGMPAETGKKSSPLPHKQTRKELVEGREERFSNGETPKTPHTISASVNVSTGQGNYNTSGCGFHTTPVHFGATVGPSVQPDSCSVPVNITTHVSPTIQSPKDMYMYVPGPYSCVLPYILILLFPLTHNHLLLFYMLQG